jgi:hypothetical protein
VTDDPYEIQAQREAIVQAVLADVRQDLAMWDVAQEIETPEVVRVWDGRIYARLSRLSLDDLMSAIVLLLVDEGEHEEIADKTLAFLRSVTT